ncbi:NUDIX domain-containing protein [Candidatus Woesearchaeota archaeon]|nr:NUDIX domain-containing protein [Candidatus Woesearchaeota archaeon]
MDDVDIIDKNEKVLRVVSTDVAHAQHLLHRAVGIVLVNSKHEVLLQLRKATKYQYPLYWCDSVAGHVDAGEMPDHAAVREMQEELGVQVPLEFVGKIIINEPEEHELLSVYFGRTDGPFVLQEEEMEEATFFPVAFLKQCLVQGKQSQKSLKMTPHLRESLKLVFAKYPL